MILRSNPPRKKQTNKKRQGQQKAVAGGGKGGGLAPPCHRTAFGLPFLSAFVGSQIDNKKQTFRLVLLTTFGFNLSNSFFFLILSALRESVRETVSESHSNPQIMRFY